MTDQKQLIKAITNLTKAVIKNTEAIKENTKLYEPEINYVESENPDGLKAWIDGINTVINGTDGLGNPVQYKKGFGGMVYGTNENIDKDSVIVSSGCVTLTHEMKE